MAGPCAGILFRQAGSASWRADVEAILRRVGTRRAEDEIGVTTTRGLGGTYDGEPRPFLIDLDDEPAWEGEDDDTPAFCEREFGMRPDREIILSAMVNGDEDHRVLGEMALPIAGCVCGVVDMGGLVTSRAMSRAHFNAPTSWLVVRKDVEAFIAPFPGRAAAHRYLVPPDREWAHHIVDPMFLRAWLDHPEFRMTK